MSTIMSSSTTTAAITPTPTIPQSTLLKIEPFVPTLSTRLRRPIGRSYSTLSSSAFVKLKRTTAQNVVDKTAAAAAAHNNVGPNINNNNKAQLILENGSITVGGLLPNVLKNVGNYPKKSSNALSSTTTTTTATGIRRRAPLKGSIHRQRSKSTSASQSGSYRPKTATSLLPAQHSNQIATTNTAGGTPTLGTPCSSPYSPTIIPQANGICRIQRNPKEQEKLPDRINYDKRGITAIPIFENEPNLRLLSLQHNLINTFHIPKQCKLVESKCEEMMSSGRANNIDVPDNNNNNGNLSNNPMLQGLAARLAPVVNSAQRSAALETTAITLPAMCASGMQQRSKLLQRNIIMQQQQQQQQQQLSTPARLHRGIRKAKSFVSNFPIAPPVTISSPISMSKRILNNNMRQALLRRQEGSINMKSFDSSTSNLTTDSGCTMLTANDIEEQEEEDAKSNCSLDLEIKNKQLFISYGNIFQNLIFLDLYDNQIERICSLDGLTALTVLLLGKNRISDISGLASLKQTLRVLDLHGNKICSIANKINSLKELKSLNLAGNQIRQINHNDFLGLENLKELNLKRNKLKRINGFQHLSALERLWLCHNDLHKIDDMASIAKAINLLEITIENNPISLAGDCVSFLVSHLPKLQTLCQMPITEQVRKAAMSWRANKQLSDLNCNTGNHEVFSTMRREEIISNARTNWELLRSQQMLQQTSGSNVKQPAAHKALAKGIKELSKISETSEHSYEEFIKLPPIAEQQQQQQLEQKVAEKTDTGPDAETLDNLLNSVRNSPSSVSSLGPNVDSSSSCYSSAEEEAEKQTKQQKHSAGNENNLGGKQQQHQQEVTVSKISDQNLNSINLLQSQEQQTMATEINELTVEATHATAPATTATATVSNTVNIQFPLQTNTNTKPNVSACWGGGGGGGGNQKVTASNETTSTAIASSTTVATSLLNCSSSASSTTATAATTLGRRTLMRSQTIVGGGAATTVAASTNNGNTGKLAATTATTSTTTANTSFAARYHQQNKLKRNSSMTMMQQSAACTQSQTPTMMLMLNHTTAAAAATNHISQSSNNNNNPLMVMANGSSMQTMATAANSTTIMAQSQSTIAAPRSVSAVVGLAAGATASCPQAPTATTSKQTAIDREREQGGDYLIEICGRFLNIYGQGALKFIDKQWNASKANDVHTFNFSYINFNNITAILQKVKIRFPHAENFVFRETNINCLGQINALAELQGITTLNIDAEGNPITLKDTWRLYTIYRLSHWGLKQLNGQEVTDKQIDEANRIYSGLSDLILWSMPDAMLQPLLTRLRLDESCTASKMSPKQWLLKVDNKSLRLVVGKEALQWKKLNQQQQQHDAFNILPTPQQVHQLYAQYYGYDNSAIATATTATVAANQTTSPSSSSTLSSPTSNSISSISANAYPVYNASNNSATNGTATSTTTTTISNAALVGLSARERGKIHFTLMMENTCNAVEKLHKLETLWPTLLLDIVRNTLLDYSQLDVYIRKVMTEIMK